MPPCSEELALHAPMSDLHVESFIGTYVKYCSLTRGALTFKRRIKSHLPFAGVVRSSPYSPCFRDKG